MAPEAPTPSLVERHARQKEWNTYWTNRYDWLLNSGYEIRPDYNPTGPLPARDQRPFSPLLDAEGKADPRHTYQMDRDESVRHVDAITRADGRLVSLKRVLKSEHSEWLALIQKLSCHPLGNDPRNHCRPVHVLDDPLDDDYQILVMAYLRDFNRPKLETVGEALECIRQVLEGAQFMQEQNISLPRLHVMNDPWRHSRKVASWASIDVRHDLYLHSRTARPVKFYFNIDMSIKARPLDDPMTTNGHSGPGDKPKVHCPAAEVWLIGAFVKSSFLKIYTNLPFLDPLVERMLVRNLAEIPPLEEVVLEFSKILNGLTRKQLRARVVERADGRGINVYKNLGFLLFRTIPHTLLRRNPLPTPSKSEGIWKDEQASGPKPGQLEGA